MSRPATAQSRVCQECGVRKRAKHFHLEARASSGLHACCKPCRSIKTKLAKYGISKARYLALVSLHPNCPICGSEEPLVVDHDHDTGFVRGLICPPCNKGLGFFRDNADSLKNAITYLEQ